MIKPLGIRFRLHPLFILIIATSILTGLFIEMVTLFIVVLIHELGHVAAAKSFGWRVQEIQLLPFGGVAVMDEHVNVHPFQEIAVAIAGPLQHLWMVCLSYMLIAVGIWSETWGMYFIQVNMMIGFFNLVPVHPLDGGKIVQALLSLMFPYFRSLMITVWCGGIASLIIIVYALGKIKEGGLPLNLLVIGFFLLYSNWYLWKNSQYHFIRFLMKRGREPISANHLPATPLIVNSKDKLLHVLQRFKQQQRHVIYVTSSSGQLQGILPEAKLLQIYFSNDYAVRAVSDLFV